MYISSFAAKLGNLLCNETEKVKGVFQEVNYKPFNAQLHVNAFQKHLLESLIAIVMNFHACSFHPA